MSESASPANRAIGSARRGVDWISTRVLARVPTPMPRRRPATVWRPVDTVRPADRPRVEVRRPRPHLLGKELFEGVLIRERKRADRSNKPLALVLLAPADRADLVAAWMWDAAIDALRAASRDPDVMGWFNGRGAVGVLLTELPRLDQAAAGELEDRFRRELARRLHAETLRKFTLTLHLHPDPVRAAGEDASVDGLLRQLSPRNGRRTGRDALKRALDIVGSSMLLLLAAPLMLLIAAAVKLGSPGPVFFRQVRIGQMRKPFTMFKFRTMRVNADHAIHHAYVSQFIKSGGQAQNGNGGVFKITNDPRVTRVGGFLRKSSLDELPQFWNVLRGEMSLVGPRPPLPYELEQYQPWHCRRVMEAKPGITGLWQVAGRSRTTFDEMVRLDLRYARSCSAWTDIKILLATPGAVISGKGAC